MNYLLSQQTYNEFKRITNTYNAPGGSYNVDSFEIPNNSRQTLYNDPFEIRITANQAWEEKSPSEITLTTESAIVSGDDLMVDIAVPYVARHFFVHAVDATNTEYMNTGISVTNEITIGPGCYTMNISPDVDYPKSFWLRCLNPITEEGVYKVILAVDRVAAADNINYAAGIVGFVIPESQVVTFIESYPSTMVEYMVLGTLIRTSNDIAFYPCRSYPNSIARQNDAGFWYLGYKGAVNPTGYLNITAPLNINFDASGWLRSENDWLVTKTGGLHYLFRFGRSNFEGSTSNIPVNYAVNWQDEMYQATFEAANSDSIYAADIIQKANINGEYWWVSQIIPNDGILADVVTSSYSSHIVAVRSGPLVAGLLNSWNFQAFPEPMASGAYKILYTWHRTSGRDSRLTSFDDGIVVGVPEDGLVTVWMEGREGVYMAGPDPVATDALEVLFTNRVDYLVSYCYGYFDTDDNPSHLKFKTKATKPTETDSNGVPFEWFVIYACGSQIWVRSGNAEKYILDYLSYLQGQVDTMGGQISSIEEQIGTPLSAGCGITIDASGINIYDHVSLETPQEYGRFFTMPPGEETDCSDLVWGGLEPIFEWDGADGIYYITPTITDPGSGYNQLHLVDIDRTWSGALTGSWDFDTDKDSFESVKIRILTDVQLNATTLTIDKVYRDITIPKQFLSHISTANKTMVISGFNCA